MRRQWTSYDHILYWLGITVHVEIIIMPNLSFNPFLTTVAQQNAWKQDLVISPNKNSKLLSEICLPYFLYYNDII